MNINILAKNLLTVGATAQSLREDFVAACSISSNTDVVLWGTSLRELSYYSWYIIRYWWWQEISKVCICFLEGFYKNEMKENVWNLNSHTEYQSRVLQLVETWQVNYSFSCISVKAHVCHTSACCHFQMLIY